MSIPQLTIQPCLENHEDENCHKSLEMLGEDPFYLEQFPGGVESTGNTNCSKNHNCKPKNPRTLP